MRIIIALGTHGDMLPDQFAALAGTYCTQHVKILNSAGLHPDRLVRSNCRQRGRRLLFCGRRGCP